MPQYCSRCRYRQSRALERSVVSWLEGQKNPGLGLNLGLESAYRSMLIPPRPLSLRTGKEYDDFVDAFVSTAAHCYPDALIHFEDFGTANANRLLKKFRPKFSVFNDGKTPR
jgi:malic enzyme